jgi:cell division septum initiation protein DivIVA
MEEMNKTNNELLERIQKLENDAAAKDKQESDLIRSHISLIQNEAKTLLSHPSLPNPYPQTQIHP